MTESNVPENRPALPPKAKPATKKEKEKEPPGSVRKELGRNPVPSFDEQHIRFCMESSDALFMVMVGVDGQISYSYSASTPAAMFALKQALEVAYEQIEMAPSVAPFQSFLKPGESK